MMDIRETLTARISAALFLENLFNFRSSDVAIARDDDSLLDGFALWWHKCRGEFARIIDSVSCF